MKRRAASMAPRSRPDVAQRHVAFAAASTLLRYPDEALLEDLPLITTTTGQLPRSVQRGLGQVCEHLSGNPLLDSQAHYVATFDLKRRCCLYLSYYLNGDTRRRGTALWRFQDVYRQAGRHVQNGELPDYLPVLLEFAATGGEVPAIELMEEHRAGIYVLIEALDELGSPYAGAVRAVDSLLPTFDLHLAAKAVRLAREGPPSELVGIDAGEALDPYGKQSPCNGSAPGGSPEPVPVRIGGPVTK